MDVCQVSEYSSPLYTLIEKGFCAMLHLGDGQKFWKIPLKDYSPGAHGDIFTPFGTKDLTQYLKPLLKESQFFLCQLGCPCHIVGADLGVNSPHKVGTCL